MFVVVNQIYFSFVIDGFVFDLQVFFFSGCEVISQLFVFDLELVGECFVLDFESLLYKFVFFIFGFVGNGIYGLVCSVGQGDLGKCLICYCIIFVL